MSFPRRLRRLHWIRQLEEDLARLAVESAVSALRQVGTGIEQALAEERAARRKRNAALAEPGAEPGKWIEAESEAQIHRVLAVRQARELPGIEKEVRSRREQYLERRRERQKIEALLAKAEEGERLEKLRRSRAAVDELFLSRRWYEGRAEER